MKTSQSGLDDIIYSEGERLIAYRDRLTRSGGSYLDVWTIGVGHTSAAGPPDVTEGMRITHEQSRDILSHDIAAVEARVLQAFKSKAPPQTVFDGAVSFDFNTGGILKASWVGLWLAGNMAEAEAHFLQWDKPPEIIGRRKREAELIFRGKYHQPYVQKVIPLDPALLKPPSPGTVHPAAKAGAGVVIGAGAAAVASAGDPGNTVPLFVGLIVIGVLGALAYHFIFSKPKG